MGVLNLFFFSVLRCSSKHLFWPRLYQNGKFIHTDKTELLSWFWLTVSNRRSYGHLFHVQVWCKILCSHSFEARTMLALSAIFSLFLSITRPWILFIISAIVFSTWHSELQLHLCYYDPSRNLETTYKSFLLEKQIHHIVHQASIESYT